MNSFGSVHSTDCLLDEQIARQIFDIWPEDGPLMIIVGKQGNYWPSDSGSFAKLNLSDSFISDICSKIDDGDEPVITQVCDFSVVGTSLATERTDCGYIIVALPHYSPESTLANMALIEILLGQIGLIAHLIERNNLLYEQQLKQLSLTAQVVSGNMLN